MRVVIDTSVLVSALRSATGASAAIVALGLNGEFGWIISAALFLEYEQVLKRSEQRDVHRRGLTEIDELLDRIELRAQPVQIHYRWRPQLLDAADEMILEAAINGQVDAIVTHNIKDFAPVERQFGIRLLTPGQFLRKVKS
jgi:putative PIN family toxin of toxin-antitoxin system